MQRQRHPVISETAASQQDQSEQDATSEPESPHYYANPELLAEKCRQLEKIPFVLVEPEPRSEQSKKRIKMLEEQFRQALKQGLKPRLELESTVLGGPLLGGWPKIEAEDDADIDYPLAETEEEWFAWKRMIDAKRDQRRRMPTSGLDKDTGSTGVVERTKPTDTKETITSQASYDTPVKGKENGRLKVSRSSRAVAPEVEWNDQSLEGALQSTPIKRDHGFVPPMPQAPGRRFASPPESRFQPQSATPLAELQIPRILQRIGEGRAGHVMPVLQNQQPKGNGSKLKRPEGSFASLMHGPSPDSLPITPVSPTLKQKPSAPTPAPLMSPSNGMMSRESVENWRKRSALIVNPQEGVSQPKSLHRRSQESPPSPTTTYFLYGSQEPQPSPRPRVNRGNSYSRELEEELERELERERQIFDLHKAVNGYSEPRRGPWNVGSYEEETEFRSQEARAVSSFVENDLGNPYRDEPYAAFDPRLERRVRYNNPYDD